MYPFIQNRYRVQIRTYDKSKQFTTARYLNMLM